MRTKTRLWWGMVGVLLTLGSMPAHAYWDDVHYGLTYLVAREVGFTPEQAYRMAAANLAIDYNEATEPQQFSETELASAAMTGGLSDTVSSDKQAPRWKFHAFHDEMKHPDSIGGGNEVTAAQWDVETQRHRLFSAAVEAGNTNPGVFLHFLQDEVPHRGYGSAWGHYYNPFSPETSTAKMRKYRLMLGGGVDWLSQYDLAANNRLVTTMVEWLSKFMKQGSPRQRPLSPTASQFETVLVALRQNSPPPGGLDIRELKPYTDYVAAKRGFGTAPALTPEQERKFAALLEGPNMTNAMAAIADAMRARGMVEMAAGGTGLPDHTAAAKLYGFDPDGGPLPEQLDKWVLTGALKVRVEGAAGLPVEVTVVAPLTVAGQAEYDLTKPVKLSIGASTTWENIPVGEVIVAARRGGDVVARQEKVRIEKRWQELTLNIGGRVAAGPVWVLREGFPKLNSTTAPTVQKTGTGPWRRETTLTALSPTQMAFRTVAYQQDAPELTYAFDFQIKPGIPQTLQLGVPSEFEVIGSLAADKPDVIRSYFQITSSGLITHIDREPRSATVPDFNLGELGTLGGEPGKWVESSREVIRFSVAKTAAQVVSMDLTLGGVWVTRYEWERQEGAAPAPTTPVSTVEPPPAPPAPPEQPGRLGVDVRTQQGADGKQEVVIGRIAPDSPLVDVLQVGDVLLAVDDVPVSTPAEARAALGKKQVGQEVKLLLRRQGVQFDMTAPLIAPGQ